MKGLTLAVSRFLPAISIFLVYRVMFMILADECDVGWVPPDWDPNDKYPHPCWKLQDTSNRVKHHGDNCTINRTNLVNDTDEPMLIIDPCMDEENRNFMECVLDYLPKLPANETGHGNGTCQCYRYWLSADGNRILTKSPYNHSMNPKNTSENWFYYNEELDECVIERGKRCAMLATEVTPYLCGNGTTCTGRLDPGDPDFIICEKPESFS
ncbi:unnamed protein product [Orchesella dallaii]|uniref:Uncharacterized protein n=1 Tax=Orchesella dallaii TaxID=48710 RepID=A0ABP1PKM1_9HEXA